jgi:hypothetical protein
VAIEVNIIAKMSLIFDFEESTSGNIARNMLKNIKKGSET